MSVCVCVVSEREAVRETLEEKGGWKAYLIGL